MEQLTEATTEVIATSTGTPSFLIGFLLVSITILVCFGTFGMFFTKSKMISNVSTGGMFILTIVTGIVACTGVEANFFPQRVLSIIFAFIGVFAVVLLTAKKINIVAAKILIALSNILGISFLLFFR